MDILINKTKQANIYQRELDHGKIEHDLIKMLLGHRKTSGYKPSQVDFDLQIMATRKRHDNELLQRMIDELKD